MRKTDQEKDKQTVLTIRAEGSFYTRNDEGVHQ